MSFGEEVAEILSSRKEDRLSKVVYLQGKKSEAVDLFGKMEERVTRTVPLNKLERLYRIDWLTWRIVNKFIEKIVTGIILEGNKRIVKEINQWIYDVGLKFILGENIRDIFLAGNAWSELGYTLKGDDIPKIIIVNPKTIDYIRDGLTGFVTLNDKTGDFIGYKRDRTFLLADVEYLKDSIKIAGKVKWRAKKEEDGRDRIVHLKLWGLGESYLGLTPLEPNYLNAIIRLNISKGTGEGAFRSGGIIAYVGTEDRPASNEQVDQLAEDLKSVETETIFAFKHNVRIERFPAPEITDRERLLYYYADTQCAGMGIPFGIILEPSARGFRGDIDLKLMDFEASIQSIQERLAYQVREKYIKRLMKARGMDMTKVPKVSFKTHMPTVMRERYRNITSLARRGIILRDPKVAMRIMEELDLPTDYVERELDIWERDKSLIPMPVKKKKGTSTDVENVEDMVEDIIEEREE